MTTKRKPMGASAALLLDLAGQAATRIDVEPSTMMGFPCLRVRGKFFASVKRDGASLIVKLSAARIQRALAAGEGISFAPNGRVFREWLEIPAELSQTWPAMLREAYLFVSETTP